MYFITLSPLRWHLWGASRQRRRRWRRVPDITLAPPADRGLPRGAHSPVGTKQLGWAAPASRPHEYRGLPGGDNHPRRARRATRGPDPGRAYPRQDRRAADAGPRLADARGRWSVFE